MSEQDQQKIFARVVARAWADDGYKTRLFNDPAGVAREEGFEFPAGAKVVVHENTGNEFHVVLPAKPEARDLSEEELDSVAGGLIICCGCTKGHS